MIGDWTVKAVGLRVLALAGGDGLPPGIWRQSSWFATSTSGALMVACQPNGRLAWQVQADAYEELPDGQLRLLGTRAAQNRRTFVHGRVG